MPENRIENLKENRIHGDFMLPFIIYYGSLNHTFKQFPIHWHEELEITIVNSGIANYMVDLVPYVVEEGDLIIINTQTLHAASLIQDIDMEWTTMVFNLKLLQSASTDGALIKYLAPIINREHTFPIVIKRNCNGYNELVGVFKNILESYEKSELAYELEIKSLLLKFLTILYRKDLVIKDLEPYKPTLSTINKLKVVLNYIHEHYNTEINITTLANLISFSEYYFMRFFKKHIGISCVQYINSYRLEKASNLLISSDLSIMDISLDVGFESLSYFIKLFKRKYSITPLEFRKNNV